MLASSLLSGFPQFPKFDCPILFKLLRKTLTCLHCAAACVSGSRFDADGLEVDVQSQRKVLLKELRVCNKACEQPIWSPLSNVARIDL